MKSPGCGRHLAPSILFLILGASVVMLAIIFEKIPKNGRKTPNFAWWHHPRWQLISSKNPGPEKMEVATYKQDTRPDKLPGQVAPRVADLTAGGQPLDLEPRSASDRDYSSNCNMLLDRL